MSKTKKSQDLGLGDFMVPLVEVLTLILTKLMQEAAKLITFLVKKYVFPEDKPLLKKIERADVSIKTSTLHSDALGFSVKENKNIFFKDIDKRMHSVIVGASGFGKTVLLDTLMYDDMKNGKPVIYIDPKGDNVSLEQFVNLCKHEGRKYKVFTERDHEEANLFLNIAKLGSASQITDRVHSSFSWSEEHYENICYRALNTAVIALKRERACIDLKTILEKVIEISNPKDSSSLFKRKDIEGLITRLENITLSDFGPKLTKEGKSFLELWDEGYCVYIGLPVLGFPKIAKSLGKMFLTDFAHSVNHKYSTLTVEELDRLTPLGVYIDELSAIITDEFINVLNKCRGARMEMTIAFQSPADIIKVSEHLNTQTLENISNWYILKQRMEDSANLFAKSFGTIESKKKTVRVENGEELSQGSERAVEELLVHANIIKMLGPGQCILLRHGPTRLDLVNIKYLNPRTVKDNILFLKEDDGIMNKEKSYTRNALV